MVQPFASPTPVKTLQRRQGFSKVSPTGVAHHPPGNDGKRSAVADCDTDVAVHSGTGVARRVPRPPPKGSFYPRSPALAPSTPTPRRRPEAGADRPPALPPPPTGQGAPPPRGPPPFPRPAPPGGAARRTPTDPRPSADPQRAKGPPPGGPFVVTQSGRARRARRPRGRRCPRSPPRSG